MTIPKLLAPAGNYEKFLAALENGADEIYMGLQKFNARGMTNNFTLAEYKQALNLAHIKGVKVYLTLNTILRDEDIRESLNLLADLVASGLDGVIVQDLGLATAIKQVFPDLPLHGSTQMTVHNIEGVRVLERLGFKRVVLARELTLEEIKEIRENTKVELEVFIHGAACVCYSGACYMSYMMGGRSANKGSCAQPCRYRYELFDDSNERIACGNLLSNKDIYGLPYIKQLADMGIESLKVEGRNRSPEYVASTTRNFRKYLDAISRDRQVEVSAEDENELLQVFNRGGKHSHYFEGKKGKDSISYLCGKNWGLPLGKILDIHNDMIKVKLFSNIDMHDGVEVLDGSLSGVVTCIRNDKKQLVNDRVKADKVVWIGDFKDHRARIGNLIYKTTSRAITDKYKETYQGKTHFRKNHLYAIVQAKVGYPLSLEVYNDDFKLKLSGKSIISKAEKKPVTRDDIEDKLTKIKDSPFAFSNIIYDMDENIFIPISEVNKLRQEAIERFTEYYCLETDVTEEKVRIKSLNEQHNSIVNIKFKETKNDIYLYDYNEKIDYASYNPKRIYIDYQLALKKPDIINKFSYLGDVFVGLPLIFKGKTKEIIKGKIPQWAQEAKGFLVPNICYFDVFKRHPEIKLIGDFTLNIYNNFSLKAYRDLGLSGFTLSLELSENDIKKLDLRDASIIAKGDIAAMTTDYCVVGSFAGGFNASTPCRKPCSISNNYYLIDQNGQHSKILCNPIDCSTRLLKEYVSPFDFNHVHPSRIRYYLS
ncbi:MAG: U32 family peptidase [Clostridia bacterium]|nr:U32 family peptidase [Clostridia bacterium]